MIGSRNERDPSFEAAARRLSLSLAGCRVGIVSALIPSVPIPRILADIRTTEAGIDGFVSP